MKKDISDIISYDKKGFIIHGKREYLIGGEFHYFRVPASQWEDRLQKMKATGANLISVYIAWNMHEPDEGHQIWDGDYDLDRFLTLCEKYGFYVLIKPGPYICAELDFGGHPDWLIQKTARGEFRLRTLDEKYLELCKYWYKSCAEQINSHLITNGGTIIAAQIENEYDHLLEYGEEQITLDDAVKYFMFLKDAMEEYGIDVPKFANEAEFLRGKGIIDTRTYYPNIPGLWMSEYERFEEKLLSSKKTQSDVPVMILELQAGWFSQIGEPTYVPGVDVLEGVSKSVFITGASIVNYYMMVGGTTFPYMGGRGDVALGGYGNITSYDFGGAPVGETGELNPEKYYWVKGFIRFFKEFAPIIAESDGIRYGKIISGGENIAVLGADGAVPDTDLTKGYENFTTYEEGNEKGRFFFVRNVESEDKNIIVQIPAEVDGRAHQIHAKIKANQTRMFPVNFTIGDTDVKVRYGSMEIWGTHAYLNTTAAIFYGAEGLAGELSVNAAPEEITVLQGSAEVYETADGSLIRCEALQEEDVVVVKVKEVTMFLLPEALIGRVEELEDGILIQNAYYLENLEDAESLKLELEVKEDHKNRVIWYPIEACAAEGKKTVVLNGKEIPMRRQPSGMQTAEFETAKFADRPEVEWTSAWKYMADGAPTNPDYDDSDWMVLEHPISLEEAGMYKHGYYWFRGTFEIEGDVADAALSFQHNGTDRYLLYLNGELVFRSRNKSIDMQNITSFLHPGTNVMTIMYANEFHNKSHPHEGAIVKYSGILNPMHIVGAYADGSAVNITLETFKVKFQLEGMDAGCHTDAYDDSAWKEAPDTEKLVIGKELGHIVWFRRHFRYQPGEGYTAPLCFIPKRADERLIVYVNGKATAQYDIIGPQEEFYIPEAFLNPDGDNVIALILECPGFFEELMGGYRRGYMYQPEVVPCYVSKKAVLEIK